MEVVMCAYDPKMAPRAVNLVVTAFVLRLVRTDLYEGPYELERSYRERLRPLDCDEAYMESAMSFSSSCPRKGKSKARQPSASMIV
jgi:hypothetical protein